MSAVKVHGHDHVHCACHILLPVSMICTASPGVSACSRNSGRHTPRPDFSQSSAPIGSFRKLGVPYFGVLRIRILLFKVLFSGPLFSETPICTFFLNPKPANQVGTPCKKLLRNLSRNPSKNPLTNPLREPFNKPF